MKVTDQTMVPYTTKSQIRTDNTASATNTTKPVKTATTGIPRTAANPSRRTIARLKNMGHRISPNQCTQLTNYVIIM